MLDNKIKKQANALLNFTVMSKSIYGIEQKQRCEK